MSCDEIESDKKISVIDCTNNCILFRLSWLMEERHAGRSYGVTFSLNKNVKETNYLITHPFFYVIELS